MINVYTVLPITGFILWMCAYFVHIIAIVWAKYHLYSWRRKKDANKISASEVGISVIKTMTASPSNSNALCNLESLFKLDYPLFEILICIPDKDNELVGQIQNIMTKYSAVNARLFTNACEIGVNPKINNMLQCYGQVQYEYVWVCDSNIFVNEWSLSELASHLNPDVGMVHQLPYIKTRRFSFANCLEQTFFGTQHSRWYLTFDVLGVCCTNGMSSLINKTYLDQAGGLSAFSCYIAEDHFIGKSFYDRGLKIILSTEPALQNPDTSSTTHFINRMTRWQKLRMSMAPASTFEPFMECFAIGLIGVFSINKLFSIPILYIFCLHIILWFNMDQTLIWIIEGKYSSLPSLGQRALVWFYRELVTYWIFIRSICSQKIHWRKGSFDIKYGGKAKSTKAEEKFA